MQHAFPVHSFVTVTRGAFSEFPAFVTKHHTSTVTGTPFPAYQIELCDRKGREVKTIVREDWLRDYRNDDGIDTLSRNRAALHAAR